MTRTIVISSLTRIATRASASSSNLVGSTIQPHHILRNTSRIQQTCYHPARRRLFSTTQTHWKQKPTETDNEAAPRKPRVYITREAVDKEYKLDEDIPTHNVRIKDMETNKLAPPQSLISILSTINRDTHCVRALATPQGEPAIVQITERAILTDKLKDKELAALESARATRQKRPKQIEINWALSSNDLSMKLKQLREFVDKGKRVDILLASRKRQRRATPEEAQNVVNEIRKTIGEIDGCKEIAPMEGAIGGQALMVIQKQ